MNAVGHNKVLRWLYPQRLRSKITFIVVLGLVFAQILTGSMWSQMRKQVLVETPARIAAARFADWYLYAEFQLAHDMRLTPALLTGVRASPLTEAPPPPYQSYISDNLGTLFDDVIHSRTRTNPKFYLVSVKKIKPTYEERPILFGLFRDDVAVIDISFTAVFQLSNGQYWQLHVVENQGKSSISTLDVIIDYFLHIYLLRLFLVVAALALCMHFILRPLDELEQHVLSMDANMNQPPIRIKGATEFQRLASAFNKMLMRIRTHMEERTHFFTAISHDLRTPITRLKLRAQRIEDEHLRDTINRDIEQLQDLVHATLELMSFKNSHEAFTEVDLSALLNTVVVNRQDIGEPITMGTVTPVIVRVQMQRIKRCVENVISNGLRYGARVTVSTHVSSKHYVITVADDGPGIPESEQEKVLQPYYRVEASRNRSTGGYGLGLSICDEVMHAHGGCLEFGRQAGRFCVRLRLPLNSTRTVKNM